MSDNYFLEEANFPDPAAVRAALGDGYSWYEGVLEAAKGFKQDWKHYGKKYGWKLKAHDGTKALFELTIVAGHFRLGMAVREKELQALRENPAANAGLAKLLDPGKSKEGWGIRLVVDSPSAYDQALLLIGSVAEIRLNG